MAHWIRVRDTITGHEFDVDKSALHPGLKPLDDPARYPDLIGDGAVPRPAKPFVGKAGEPATPATTTADAVDETKPAATKRTGRAAGTTEGVES